MTNETSEKVLLYRLRVNQDTEAFAALYDLYVKRIYRFVFFKVSGHEEAEDIASEVFLKAWNYISEEKKEVKSFSGLLYRIARNCIIDLYRSKSFQANPLLISRLPEGVELGDAGRWVERVGAELEAKRIIHAIKKLKQEYQEVVTLKYIDQLTIAEISEITGKGKVAVRVTIHRAVKKLKEMMEQ